MDKSVINIFIVIFGLFLWIKWFFAAKGTPYRKNILLWGICLIISGVTYIVRISFHVGTALLSLIGIFVFLTSWYFLIRALIGEKKFKKDLTRD